MVNVRPLPYLCCIFVSVNINGDMTSDVFNQDCIEYMRTLPDGFFHLAVADPPYGQADKSSGWGGGRFGGPKTARFYKYRKQDADNDLAVSWDTAPDADFFSELARVSQHQIIWGANFFPQMPPCKCFITWVKEPVPQPSSTTRLRSSSIASS